MLGSGLNKQIIPSITYAEEVEFLDMHMRTDHHAVITPLIRPRVEESW